ncbi:hypothetical protein NPIL_377991, partial [Nephila pilipes]
RKPSSKQIEDVLYHYASLFVQECTFEFGWRDLSKDIVMDVGSGRNLNCSNVILKEFPDVRALIAIDKDQSVFETPDHVDERISCYVANILSKDTLKPFIGKIDKVISTNVIHKISRKRPIFQNVYRMLKPGGEAAFFFLLDSCYYQFLTKLLKIPKFKDMFKGRYNPNMYPKHRRYLYYKDMLEDVGFCDVVSKVEEKIYPHPSEEDWKNALYAAYKDSFEISPESVDEIKEIAFEIYLRTIERYEGEPCYRVLSISLFCKKNKVQKTYEV